LPVEITFRPVLYTKIELQATAAANVICELRLEAAMKRMMYVMAQHFDSLSFSSKHFDGKYIPTKVHTL
jgi:hypothetical protein